MTGLGHGLPCRRRVGDGRSPFHFGRSTPCVRHAAARDHDRLERLITIPGMRTGWTMASRRCIAFGGLRVDDAIEDALLTVVGPGAIAAAVAAEKKPTSGAIKCAKHSSAISKRRAMQPIAPSGNTTPPTLPTGWWPANWRRAGTTRWRASRRSKASSPPMMPPRSRPLPIQYRSPHLLLLPAARFRVKLAEKTAP